MGTYYHFRSGKDPELQAFTDDLTGDKLPESIKSEDDLHGELELSIAGHSHAGSIGHEHGHDHEGEHGH